MDMGHASPYEHWQTQNWWEQRRLPQSEQRTTFWWMETYYCRDSTKFCQVCSGRCDIDVLVREADECDNGEKTASIAQTCLLVLGVWRVKRQFWQGCAVSISSGQQKRDLMLWCWWWKKKKMEDAISAAVAAGPGESCNDYYFVCNYEEVPREANHSAVERPWDALGQSEGWATAGFLCLEMSLYTSWYEIMYASNRSMDVVIPSSRLIDQPCWSKALMKSVQIWTPRPGPPNSVSNKGARGISLEILARFNQLHKSNKS